MYDVSAGSALRLPAAICPVTISERDTIADCTSSQALVLVLLTSPPAPPYCAGPSVTPRSCTLNWLETAAFM